MKILTVNQALHYFLQNENIGGLEIGAWALGKPCQIYPLANIVVESTTGLMLFRKLATSPEFVKAVFEVKPSWLKDVLDQTATSLYTSPSPDDLNCCSAVSSCYLPRCEEYLAPSPRYYQEAAASVIQCPNKASLRHLSAIYSSTLTNILDLLDERLLSELSSRCKEVCVNATEDSNVEVMLAQDILAQVAMAFLTPQTQSKNSLETPPAARYSETSRRRMLKLSGDANASSILRLTILRLSLFCSETRKYSPLTVLEAVKLAQRIILPIGRPVRCQWTADAKNSKLLEKFLPRIAYKGLDLNVRLEVSIQDQPLPFLIVADSFAGSQILHFDFWS